MRYKKPSREDLPNPSRPKSYVKPLTLGDLAADPNTVVEAECEWCRHRAQLDVGPLIEKLGWDAEMRRLQEKLKCSVCGWHICDVWTTGRGRNREDEVERMTGGQRPLGRTPLPPLAECRAALAAVPKVTGFAGEQHSAYMQAIMDRWPEIDAGMAFSIVTTLRHELPDK